MLSTRVLPGVVASRRAGSPSVRRTLASPPAPPSPLLAGRRGTSWRFEVLECPLADLKAAAKSAHGSLNDAYVAALLGGLRRYHELHGVRLDDLSMVMPVSLRKADDPMGGNKFAGAYFAAPAGIEDPAERIAVLRGMVLTMRVEPALDTLSLVAPLLNRVPSRIGQRPSTSSAAPPSSPRPTCRGCRIRSTWPAHGSSGSSPSDRCPASRSWPRWSPTTARAASGSTATAAS